MTRTIHYVGMSDARYRAARRVFGGPAYYHKYMDARVYSEVGDSDVVVIGDPIAVETALNQNSYILKG